MCIDKTSKISEHLKDITKDTWKIFSLLISMTHYSYRRFRHLQLFRELMHFFYLKYSLSYFFKRKSSEKNQNSYNRTLILKTNYTHINITSACRYVNENGGHIYWIKYVNFLKCRILTECRTIFNWFNLVFNIFDTIPQ